MESIKLRRGATLAALAALVIIPLAVQDYFTYLSYGPGGLPYNAFGWLVTNALRLLSREQFSTHPYYDVTWAPGNQHGYLPHDFPQRRGSRPKIGPHPVPQRQLTQPPNKTMRQKLITRFNALGRAAQEKSIAEIKQSLLERHHSALFVSTSLKWHPITQQMRGEIAHVHAGKDGSVHVVLHPEDCIRVIGRGWGQRHAFSGVGVMKRIAGFELPVNYLLVYAPRDEKEADVVIGIVEASVWFMTGVRESVG